LNADMLRCRPSLLLAEEFHHARASRRPHNILVLMLLDADLFEESIHFSIRVADLDASRRVSLSIAGNNWRRSRCLDATQLVRGVLVKVRVFVAPPL
jgi:hypothetical protein